MKLLETLNKHTEMSSEEFLEWITSTEEVPEDTKNAVQSCLEDCVAVLSCYDFFYVFKNRRTGEFLYVDENSEVPVRVQLIARLDYNTQHDCRADVDILDSLFDSFCCGETGIRDDGRISYLWFETVK